MNDTAKPTGQNQRLSFAKSKDFTRAIEEIVPGGAHTYSRGRDQFPLEAPSGIVRGKGAHIWDADGNRLIDWAMGLGSVSLGHAYPAVTTAVAATLENGVNFQRPTQLEYEAAKLWTEVTGDDMVKFARHGSSVTTAAVKLARGHTGRTKVAVPAEHPFFSFDDWFIGATDADFGVPEAIKQFTLKFHYNDIESLHRLFRDHKDDIACVMLEPVKFEPPQDDFLHKVRDLCTRHGAVLVFDEMVTGLKMAIPGAGANYGVKADISTWGKGIANGFAISALTGKAEIMNLGGLEPEGARKLFLLSSTHGGEVVGFAALMATVKEFLNHNIIDKNRAAGNQLRTQLEKIIERHGLGDYLGIVGDPVFMLVTTLGPKGDNDNVFRTLFMQEMMASGILCQGFFIVTPSHGPDEVAETATAFDRTCGVYKQAIAQGSVDGLLTGPAIKPVFRRFL